MSKITKDSIEAFCTGTAFKRGNMQVVIDGGKVKLLQHGNLIAIRDTTDSLYDTCITNAGWWSVTTKERLNALLTRATQGAWGLYSEKGEWVLFSRKHGEDKPFTGTAYISDLIELDNQIANERAA